MQESITFWLAALRQGNQDAARGLWERYYARLVRLVRARLSIANIPLSSRVDDENAPLEAFHVFCTKQRDGLFPDLSNRQQLWPLLVTITLNRTRDEIRTASAQKRGFGKQVLTESQLGFNSPSEGEAYRLDHLPALVPTPDQITLMADECRGLLEALNDPELEQVALWKLDGLTDEEVAEKLGYSRRTVQRMLHLIRVTWEGYLAQRRQSDAG